MTIEILTYINEVHDMDLGDVMNALEIATTPGAKVSWATVGKNDFVVVWKGEATKEELNNAVKIEYSGDDEEDENVQS